MRTDHIHPSNVLAAHVVVRRDPSRVGDHGRADGSRVRSPYLECFSVSDAPLFNHTPTWGELGLVLHRLGPERHNSSTFFGTPRSINMAVNVGNEPSEVSLEGMKPFGVGGRRLCFVDPRDANRCIKVLRQDARRTVRSRSNWIPERWRRVYDNNAHEEQELAKTFARVGPEASQCLPRCYGYVPTNLGPGLVLDLIRDHDGKISRSLRELVSIGRPPETFRPAFEVFSQFMIVNSILSRAILDHNLAAQKRSDDSWNLYLIDGLGDPAWLPFAQFSRRLARSKIKRKLDAFWPRLELLAKEPVAPEQVAKSNWGQGFLDHRGESKP